MTTTQARKIEADFYNRSNPSEEDIFAFTEAMEFLIDKEHKPQDMMNLGGYYYEIKRFDLALKYYEMAAAYDYDPADECLGYIWYYGRTGEKDYEKAFRYFSKAADRGNTVAAYKVADMYKNGYFVDKDQAKYEQMIEALYLKVKSMRHVFDPVPEVFTRLAKIRTEQGRTEEAVNLYLTAKDFLAQRIRYNAFFGNLNIMKWLIDDLYELIEFDRNYFDLFDLYYLLRSPNTITFYYKDEQYEAEAIEEGGACAVRFDGKWFRDRDDFFGNAVIGDEKLVAVNDDLYGFEVK